MIMAKFLMLLFKLWGDIIHKRVPKFDVCLGKSADTEATIGLLQFFFKLSRMLYEHVEV